MDDYCRVIDKEMKLQAILEEENPLDCVYAYWIVDGKRVKPAIIKNHGAHTNFLEDLRDEFGAYEYEIMIRRKRTMIIKCRMKFGEPLNFVPAKDIYAEIARLRKEKNSKKIMREISKPQNQCGNAQRK